jgi:hypothetical protein
VPSLAVRAGALLPTGDAEKGLGNGRACAQAVLAADWDVKELKVHANAGLSVNGRPVGSRERDNGYLAALSAEWEPREGYTLLGEYSRVRDYGAPGPVLSDVLLGGRIRLAEALDLDLGIRWGLSEGHPDVAYQAGVTAAFGRGGGAESLEVRGGRDGR